jgi:hypothetical protein
MRNLRINCAAAAILAALLHATSGPAQHSSNVGPVLGPVPEPPRDVTALPGHGPRPLDGMKEAGFNVNINSREQARQFYNAVYTASDGFPINSTADTADCAAGTNSAAFENAVLWRINWFRAMSGIPAAVTFDAGESAADQSAALIMSANDYLMHTGIPANSSCFSANGTNAAFNSDLALGVNGPDAITGYIFDYGYNNWLVGHRRLILYPQTQVMASGDVPAQGAFQEANATWVLDANYGGPRPATAAPFVAWPPPGYVPYPVVFPQWSFSLSNADLSLATVTMQSNGVLLSVEIQPYFVGVGENTLVWYPAGVDTGSYINVFPFNGTDTVYAITISNVNVETISNGAPAAATQSFSYNVTVFDPALPGADFVPAVISGTNHPFVNENNLYSCTPSANPNTTGYQWLVAQAPNGNLADNALNGLANFTISPAPGYAVILTNPPAGSGQCFHLTHTNPAPQLLEFTEVLFPSTNTSLSFRSFLGWASTNETARVQISTNDSDWMDIYAQPGTGSGGQTNFAAITLSLSNCAGRITYLRFNYDFDDYAGSPYYNEVSPNFGWCIENIVITNASQLVNFTTNSTVSTNFNFVPVQSGGWVLETRGVIFDQFAMDWSPASLLSAVMRQCQLEVLTNGGGTIKPNYNGQWLTVTSNYSMTAAAAAGFAFTNWTGGTNQPYSVLAATSNLTFQMASNLTLIANFVDVTPPACAVTFPANNQRWSNSTITVTGTAKDNVQVSNVFCQVNSGNWTLATPGNSAWSNWTANLTLTPGTNTIRAYAQDTTGNISTNTNKVTFLYIPSATLTVLINGNGSIAPADNGKLLAIGTNYTLTAAPGANWLFSNWTGGITAPGAVLGTNLTCVFPMQSNLVLAANFVTNFFLAAQGNYYGLFAPASPPRRQTNSGSFILTVTSAGVASGDLFLGAGKIPFSNVKFNVSGMAQFTATPSGGKPLSATLQLNPGGQSVQGTVTDGSFTSVLNGDQEVFNSTNQATNFEGQYNFVIFGVSDPAIGPLGNSFGTVTVSSNGMINFTGGSLADGTTGLSQSSGISKDGRWPFYVPLHNGAGSLWGTNYFTNHTLLSAPFISWINPANSTQGAFYRSGFTNQQAVLTGSFYNPSNNPFPGLMNLHVTLVSVNPPVFIAKPVTWASNNTITVPASAGNTNGLVLTNAAKTGLISGSFVNPANAKQTIKVSGVVLQGRTSAAGYFPGTNQSGSFLLSPAD